MSSTDRQGISERPSLTTLYITLILESWGSAKRLSAATLSV